MAAVENTIVQSELTTEGNRKRRRKGLARKIVGVRISTGIWDDDTDGESCYTVTDLGKSSRPENGKRADEKTDLNALEMNIKTEPVKDEIVITSLETVRRSQRQRQRRLSSSMYCNNIDQESLERDIDHEMPTDSLVNTTRVSTQRRFTGWIVAKDLSSSTSTSSSDSLSPASCCSGIRSTGSSLNLTPTPADSQSQSALKASRIICPKNPTVLLETLPDLSPSYAARHIRTALLACASPKEKSRQNIKFSTPKTPWRQRNVSSSRALTFDSLSSVCELSLAASEVKIPVPVCLPTPNSWPSKGRARKAQIDQRIGSKRLPEKAVSDHVKRGRKRSKSIPVLSPESGVALLPESGNMKTGRKRSKNIPVLSPESGGVKRGRKRLKSIPVCNAVNSLTIPSIPGCSPMSAVSFHKSLGMEPQKERSRRSRKRVSGDSAVHDDGEMETLGVVVKVESEEAVAGNLEQAGVCDSEQLLTQVKTVKRVLCDDRCGGNQCSSDGIQLDAKKDLSRKRSRSRIASDPVPDSPQVELETPTVVSERRCEQKRGRGRKAVQKSVLKTNEDVHVLSSANAEVLASEHPVNVQDELPPCRAVHSPVVIARRGNKYVGGHIGISGNVSASLKVAHMSGLHALGMFIKRQTTLFPEPLQSSDIAEFKQLIKTYNMAPHLIVPHASYLLNCGSSDLTVFYNSRASLVDDLRRCHALGLPLFNFHPGCYGQNSNAVECIKRIASCVNFAHARVPSVITVLENTCKRAYSVGGDFMELRQIIDEIVDKSRVGVCLDLCHAFAGGYDLNAETGRNKMMQDLTQMVGLKYLKAVHISNSHDDVCSRRDHHVPINKGKINLDVFNWLMNDPRFDNIPVILETPSHGHRSEMELLYSFVH